MDYNRAVFSPGLAAKLPDKADEHLRVLGHPKVRPRGEVVHAYRALIRVFAHTQFPEKKFR